MNDKINSSLIEKGLINYRTESFLLGKILSNSGEKKYHYIPNQISGMTDIELIDTGGFGAVFKGYHILDENYYALKCIPIDNKNNKIPKKT